VRRQVTVIWDLEEDADGNYGHIVIEHGVSQDEVDDVMCDSSNATTESDASGRPITFGWTQTGRHLAVVWDAISDDPYTIKPVTAYDAPPRTQSRRRGSHGRRKGRKMP
jgi:uncharacterized DUF497 family protein